MKWKSQAVLAAALVALASLMALVVILSPAQDSQGVVLFLGAVGALLPPICWALVTSINPK